MMVKVLEKLVDVVSRFVFDNTEVKKSKKEVKKEGYVLSSVFPSTQIMKEVEKLL